MPSAYAANSDDLEIRTAALRAPITTVGPIAAADALTHGGMILAIEAFD